MEGRKMFGIIFLFCAPSLALAVLPFNFTDCNHSPNKIFHVESVQLGNFPFLDQGNNTLTVDVQISKQIVTHNYRLSLRFSKKLLFGWLAIPCGFVLGSNSGCENDLCSAIRGDYYNSTDNCLLQLLPPSPDRRCACPFEPGRYRFNLAMIGESILYHWPKYLIQGDYHINIQLNDTNTNEQVVCYNIQTSIISSSPTTIFGKK